MTFAKLLEIRFQGYFLCRIATDPDPTNERRGISGYTMALAGESPLDQTIRTQLGPDVPPQDLREPMARSGIRIGVDVYDVLFDGRRFPRGRDALAGARVSLEGENPPFPGPTFDSRNNIVGSDDNLWFVVNPFELAIQNHRVAIRAVDHLNAADPEQKIWQIEDPDVYRHRLPVAFNSNSTEAMAAIRVFDQFGYFRDRVRFLEQRIADLEKEIAAGTGDPAEHRARIEGFRSRIYQIELWGTRVNNKLGFQLTYRFNVNGPQSFEGEEHLGGKVDRDHPWPVESWFGGWDGDLLTGYMRGALSVPFLPD